MNMRTIMNMLTNKVPFWLLNEEEKEITSVRIQEEVWCGLGEPCKNDPPCGECAANEKG